jgi:hypothetical protein
MSDRRGVAQSGSASALGAEGRGFESLRPDHLTSSLSIGLTQSEGWDTKLAWESPMDVNITKRIDTPDGRRFSKVIFTPDGCIKPDWVEVEERQEKHPEGAYYLDWTEDGQRRHMAVGSDATAVSTA